MNKTYPSCPKCKKTNAERIKYHPHYGALGPMLMEMVKCNDCQEIYNGKTGTTEGLNSYKKTAGLILAAGLAFLAGITLIIINVL